jgi:GNAT superfamily N-acetyltransferase
VILSDLALSRRLERAEGHACRRFVEAHARVSPAIGSEWIEVGGAYAMYDGPRSPVTQTFCLGLFEPATDQVLAEIEAFYWKRNAPVNHEVSPLADKAILTLLGSRGYRPIELSSVMFQTIGSALAAVSPTSDRIRVRVIGAGELDLWAGLALEGWREEVEFEDLMIELMRANAARENCISLIAELDGEPVGTGALCLGEGIALLAGAATIPKARNQGVQRALLAARLRLGAEAGCDLAMINVAPGSASQRNAERQGFRIAYTRIKWGFPDAPPSGNQGK